MIGFGNIGRELHRQLTQPAVATRLGLQPKPEFVLRSKDNGRLAKMKDLPDVVFVAIPSTDNGRPAYGYISAVLKKGKVVVTAEKGALANNFAALQKQSDDFKRLGVNATVGGGTRLVSALQQYCEDPANIRQLHLALNGTLTAIFSTMTAGTSLDRAVEQAVKAGYAEPGHQNPQDVIRSEAEGDTPKKAAILFNSLGLSRKVLDWRQLEFKLSDDDISHAVKEAQDRRFVVSVYPAGRNGPETGVIGGFRVRHDGWLVVGGFRHMGRNPLFYSLANLTGPGCGFVIGLGPDESDGIYSLSGPGAGPSPTVNTMLDDYLSLK